MNPVASKAAAAGGAPKKDEVLLVDGVVDGLADVHVVERRQGDVHGDRTDRTASIDVGPAACGICRWLRPQ